MFHVKHPSVQGRCVRATRMEYPSPFNAERASQAETIRCTEQVSIKKKSIFLPLPYPLPKIILIF